MVFLDSTLPLERLVLVRSSSYFKHWSILLELSRAGWLVSQEGWHARLYSLLLSIASYICLSRAGLASYTATSNQQTYYSYNILFSLCSDANLAPISLCAPSFSPWTRNPSTRSNNASSTSNSPYPPYPPIGSQSTGNLRISPSAKTQLWSSGATDTSASQSLSSKLILYP